MTDSQTNEGTQQPQQEIAMDDLMACYMDFSPSVDALAENYPQIVTPELVATIKSSVHSILTGAYVSKVIPVEWYALVYAAPTARGIPTQQSSTTPKAPCKDCPDDAPCEDCKDKEEI